MTLCEFTRGAHLRNSSDQPVITRVPASANLAASAAAMAPSVTSTS
jgi:hypothetical protein